ncbi:MULTISPECIES: YqcI/YcgG family protein [Methylosinus]|uniref:YqcI/YcgG family protein n=1 Tax=Methylosinus TaxID=425 RepID=UPI0001D2D4EA|nr:MULTISPECIES: YqcI/YcgG family protein [Methylosinus]
MEAFSKLQGSTLCPFAAKAEIEYGPPWCEELGFDDNIIANARRLAAHIAEGRLRRTKGFVSQINLCDAVDFESTVVLFRRFVFGLAIHDVSCKQSLTRDLGAVGWSLMFAEEPIFLNLFAPCYPRAHSKHIENDGNLYVFIQPEYTFDFCEINRTKVKLKEQIRERFAEAGMPYDSSTIDTRRKALSFVFPVHHGDPPIRWWESTLSNEWCASGPCKKVDS